VPESVPESDTYAAAPDPLDGRSHLARRPSWIGYLSRTSKKSTLLDRAPYRGGVGPASSGLWAQALGAGCALSALRFLEL
jgi:hypothetical protein